MRWRTPVTESSPMTLSSAVPPAVQRRTPIWRYALIVILAAELLFVVASRTKTTLIAGPMIQFPTPDKLVVAWEMNSPFTAAVVTLVDDQGNIRTATVDPVADASRTDFGGLTRVDARRYEAIFSGLSSDVEFTYTINSRRFPLWNAPVAGPYTVRTPPSRGKPFRFLAFGDSGVGSYSQADLAAMMAAQKPDLIIHAGDVNQFAGAPTDYSLIFFEPYAALIRSIPLVPVLGNHDCATDSGKPLLDFFVLPENGPVAAWKERNFYFDFGDVRFVGLDANQVQDRQAGVITPDEMKSTVAPWLRDVLTHCDARWKIVYYHQPFYTGSSHSVDEALDFKNTFVEVFEECGVALVFSGHNHLYERTAPILRDQVVAEGKGVVYLTVGTGGASRYAMHQPPPNYNRAYNDRLLGFSCIDVTAHRLELRQIGDDGRVIDHYVINNASAALVQVSGS